MSDERNVPGITPIPSRDEILEFIRSSPHPVGKREIARAFNLRGAGKIELKAILKEMMEDGVLDRDYRKNVKAQGEMPSVAVLDVTGRDVDGELIATPANWNEKGLAPSIVIAPGRPHDKEPVPGIGNRILARMSKAQDAYDYEARVIKILGKGEKRILGVFQKTGSEARVTPVDKKARDEFIVQRGDYKDARNGDLVWTEIARGNQRRGGIKAVRVVEVLGPAMAARSVSLIAIAEHGIPMDFPDKAVEEAEAAKPVSLGRRTDLRHLPLVTIDPPDARDHDDAVYAEKDSSPRNEGGYHVFVAIADVAHYVKPDSALDREAIKRGNSCYFPDRVVPMLPEALSTDLCSLKEGVDRACMAVRMTFDKNGKKISHEFVRGLMRSAASLSYKQAQDAIDGKADEKAGPLLDAVLKPLYAAYAVAKKGRDRRAPLELDLPERRIEINDAGQVERISLRERFDAHKLIEEFMIQANVCAAESLEKKRMICMYRVHDTPSDDKVDALSEFMKAADIPFSRGQTLLASTFNRVLEKAKDTAQMEVVNMMVLRSQSQACYSPDNLGHFGLNLARYAHFTSPIRRYADLLVHRGLIRALDLGEDGLDDETIEQFEEIGKQISDTERRAMLAERDSTDRYLAAYMSERLDTEQEGRISGVTRFGLFVSLTETGADGMIPMRTLGSEFFHHDESRHALIGERTGSVYQLGMKVLVRVVEAAPVSGGLRFELLEVDDQAPPLMGGLPNSTKSRRGKTVRSRTTTKARPGSRDSRENPKHKAKTTKPSKIQRKKAAISKVSKKKKAKKKGNAKPRAM